MKKKGPAPRGSSVCLSFDLCRYRSAVQTPDIGTSASMQILRMHALTDSRNFMPQLSVRFSCFLFCFFHQTVRKLINLENHSHIWVHLKLHLAALRFGSSGTSSVSLFESASSSSGPSQLSWSAASSAFLADPASRVGPSLLGSPPSALR